MQTHAAKRVEITIELVMQARLTRALEDAGVHITRNPAEIGQLMRSALG